MKDLLAELTQARHQAAGCATDEAQRHITEALELVRDLFGGCGAQSSSARGVLAYITDARFFLDHEHFDRAVNALRAAIETLKQKQEIE